jgi:hypothetical protein
MGTRQDIQQPLVRLRRCSVVLFRSSDCGRYGESAILSNTSGANMKPNIAEFPKHPLPHVPPPQQPQPARVQPPTVFVYEKQEWEYKVVSKDAADARLTEDDLNALGKDGWELVGVVPLPNGVQFYLKRVRR